MNKKIFSFYVAGSFVLLLTLLSNPVYADSTVGTNMSTTGTFTQTVGSATAARFQNAAGTTNTLWVDTTNNKVGVNAGSALDTTFEVGGTASISGIITLGGSGTTGGQFRPATDGTTAFRFQNAAGTSILTIDTSNTRLLIGKSGSNPLTTLEVGGTASISGTLTLTGITTSTNTGSNSFSGSLEVSKGVRATNLSAPTSGTLIIGSHVNKPAANSATAFQFQNAAGTVVMAVDTTNTRVGINYGNNLDTTFEVGGTASASTFIGLTNIVAGTNAASASSTYIAEFATRSTTASTSILFGGNSATLGTCLKMKTSTGSDVFVRVVGTAFVINTTSCR